MAKNKKIETHSENKSVNVEYIFLGLVLLFIALIRWRLLGLPMERDEGEYAYMGSLILDGIAPFKAAYNMKYPGTNFMFAFFMLFFGKTITGVHLGLMVTNLISMFLIYKIVKKLFTGGLGVVSAMVFGLLTISYSVLGFAAHATHFVMLFAIAGFYCLLIACETNKLLHFLFAGFLVGMAFIMKQSGVFFIPAYLIISMVLVKENLLKKTISAFIVGLGSLIPFILMVTILYASGTYDRFYFWTVTYASQYGNQVPLSQAFEMLGYSLPGLLLAHKWLWIMGFLGVVLLFITSKKDIKIPITLAIFFIFSILAVCPGFYFRQHYFIQFMPALSIAVAGFLFALDQVITQKIKSEKLYFVKYVLIGLVILFVIISENQYLFKQKPVRFCKMIYSSNPFVESPEIAKFLKERTNENDKIAVLGSEPQICFYAGRKSATGYIYTYNLMEKHPYALEMQKEMIKEIEESKPKFLLMVNERMSWLSRPESENYIFNWYSKYSKENYDFVGMVDINPAGESTFIYQPELNSYQPQSQSYILIFEKKKV